MSKSDRISALWAPKLKRALFKFGLMVSTTPSAYAAMPTASLPIEPATSDKEFYSEPAPSPATGPVSRRSDTNTESESPTAAMERSVSQSSGIDGVDGYGVSLRLSMIKEGFGAQLKLMEYPRSWLAITQTFRYFKTDETDRLYAQRQGFLIGVDMHPWRKKFVSPFLNSQVGWEKFYREDGLATLDSAVVEASAGLELRLGRMASVVGQWTETYYPGLKEPLFQPLRSNEDPKRHAVAEVLFNLKWESN